MASPYSDNYLKHYLLDLDGNLQPVAEGGDWREYSPEDTDDLPTDLVAPPQMRHLLGRPGDIAIPGWYANRAGGHSARRTLHGMVADLEDAAGEIGAGLFGGAIMAGAFAVMAAPVLLVLSLGG